MHPPQHTKLNQTKPATTVYINKFKEEKNVFHFIFIWNIYSFCLFPYLTSSDGLALPLLQFVFLWAPFFLVLLFFFLSLSSDSSLLIRDKNFVRCSYFVVMCVLHPILMAMMLLHFNGLMMRVFYTTCDGRYKNKTIGFIFYSNVNHCPLLSIAAIGTSPFFIASPRLALPIWSWTHFTAAYMFFVSSWLTPARFSDIAAKV